MQPLTGQQAAPRIYRRAIRPQRDPAPSRIAYRLHRLWLTPLFRATLRVGLPAFLVVFTIGALFSDAARRDRVAEAWADLRAAIEARPEFQVARVEILGASPTVEAALLAMGPSSFPVSSFHLNLDDLRAEFESLDAVARADLRIRSGGVLEARVQEREPKIVWRSREGLELLDGEGHRIAFLRQRAARADLPLIGGDGADRQVPEALALIAAAAPLGERVAGLMRMGERRWDVVMDDGQRILLPEEGAVAALERVIALAQAQDLLERDIELVDIRNAGWPTLRLSPEALSEIRRIRALEQGAGSQ